MDGIATLITETYTRDGIGNPVVSGTTSRDVFVTEISVSRQEWADAGRIGLKPEAVLETPRINYNDEKVVQYNGKTYSVYRTFAREDVVELYLTLKGGRQ